MATPNFLYKTTNPFVLFYFLNDSFECFGIVHCQIGKDFTINFDSCFMQCTH